MGNGATQSYSDYLRQELERTALDAAAPMVFTPQCQNRVFRAIQESIEQRWSGPDAPPETQRLQVAKASVRDLVAQMKMDAHRLGSNRLEEEMFFGALRKLCPFWPFC